MLRWAAGRRVTSTRLVRQETLLAHWRDLQERVVQAGSLQGRRARLVGSPPARAVPRRLTAVAVCGQLDLSAGLEATRRRLGLGAVRLREGLVVGLAKGVETVRRLVGLVELRWRAALAAKQAAGLGAVCPREGLEVGLAKGVETARQLVGLVVLRWRAGLAAGQAAGLAEGPAARQETACWLAGLPQVLLGLHEAAAPNAASLWAIPTLLGLQCRRPWACTTS